MAETDNKTISPPNVFCYAILPIVEDVQPMETSGDHYHKMFETHMQ